MDRKRAKLITLTGIFFCLFSLILFILSIAGTTNLPQFVLPVFFVGGIIMIILSLAYYTDK